MSVLTQFLITTALIAAMIFLRVFANRRVIRQRLGCEPADSDCSDQDCFHGCGGPILQRPMSPNGPQ
jgi:hypothetical protein